MGKKYIIDLNPDCVEGEYLRIPARIAGEEQWLVTKAALTPYTEPDLEQVRKEAYDEGYADAKGGYKNGFENGMIVAWDAARKIGNMPYGEEENVFGSGGWAFIEKHTATEAIEKLKAFEEQKEFHVGDEFENESGKRFVITKMNGTEIDRYIDEEGSTYRMNVKYKVMRKTGRHFPEIDAVLEKMRGESND